MSEVELLQAPDERVMTRVFRGYSRFKAPVPSKAGYTGIDLADCMNMASEQYPCALVREPRRTVYMEDKATGAAIALLPGKMLDCINHGGTLAYLLSDGSVMCGKHRWSWISGQTLNKGRIYQFGAGIFSPSTNMYIRDVNQADSGYVINTEVTAKFNVSYTTAEGADFPDAADAASAPASPTEGDYYHNTTDGKLYKYTSGSWTEVTERYYHNTTNDSVYEYDGTEWDAVEIRHMKLKPATTTSPVDIAKYLKAVARMAMLKTGDHLTITDMNEDADDDIGTVNVSKVLITMEDEQITEIAAVIDTLCPQYTKKEFNIQRKMPLFDFAVVHDNRVWACRYGENIDGAFVNEIYACRLGDPTNWYAFDGLTEDSFMASCGEPGEWTGAAVVGDNVVFFKEHCMYTIYGDTPSTYTVKVDYCPGIEKGSDKSVALINGYTYYNSPHGIMRLYTGTLPVKISDELMFKQVLRQGIGGTDGRKYYMLANNVQNGHNELIVYDTELQEWHIEEIPFRVTECGAFVKIGGDLLAIRSHKDGAYHKTEHTFVSAPVNSRLVDLELYLCQDIGGALIYPDNAYYSPTDTDSYETNTVQQVSTEKDISWSFTTGNFGLNEPDYKRVKSISIRSWLDVGASYKTEIMYDDDGTWHELEASKTFSGGGETGTNRVEYRLRRCDLYRLRISGNGRACIYSITHTYEGDGNRSYGANSV